MPARNPRSMGVSDTFEVTKDVVNTTSPGEALVTTVVVGSSLEFTYSGVDAGTGDVVISLPVIPGSAGRTFTSVVIDSYGRVVGGTEGSMNGDYILNSTASRQAGGFVTDTGDVTTFVAMTITTNTLHTSSLVLNSPLGVASGGTGAATVSPHLVFAGPVSSTGAPSFRMLVADDLPDYPFSKITPHPTTLVGYGITDAYDKTTSDSRFAALIHSHAGYEPAYGSGNTSQYLRGDKTWQNLTTDAVQESLTRKFYTDAYARSALSVTGTNLSYDTNSGVFGFASTPGFNQVALTSAPTQNSHAATKQYVDTAVSGIVQRTPSSETFVVTVPSVLTYTLAHTPSPGSVVVSLNGLVCTADVTVTTNQIVFDSDVVLYVSDTIIVAYWY